MFFYASCNSFSKIEVSGFWGLGNLQLLLSLLNANCQLPFPTYTYALAFSTYASLIDSKTFQSFNDLTVVTCVICFEMIVYCPFLIVTQTLLFILVILLLDFINTIDCAVCTSFVLINTIWSKIVFFSLVENDWLHILLWWQGAQFEIGHASMFSAAFWYSVEGKSWHRSDHYMVSYDNPLLDFISGGSALTETAFFPTVRGFFLLLIYFCRITILCNKGMPFLSWIFSGW